MKEHYEVITHVKNVKILHYYWEILKDIIGSPGYWNIYIFHYIVQETQTNFLANPLEVYFKGQNFKKFFFFFF